jgi:hypothetical protein
MTEEYKERNRGDKNSQSIFTMEQIRQLRSWYASLDPKPSFKTIAIKYDTVPSVIYNIIKYNTYKELL